MKYDKVLNVILDANVIYPAPIRDLLLNIADQELYNPKWSKRIEDEWVRNLLKNRPDLRETRIERTVTLMNQVFPNAKVKSFEKLIKSIVLPDQDDRHVVAAAIKSESKIIVTSNTKDFPKVKLKELGIEIFTPDKFIILLSKIDIDLVKAAFDTPPLNYVMKLFGIVEKVDETRHEEVKFLYNLNGSECPIKCPVT